jgi:hypothetical protein
MVVRMDGLSITNLLAVNVASQPELAFGLNRCLRKPKISSPMFADILNERSPADGVTQPPGHALISA